MLNVSVEMKGLCGEVVGKLYKTVLPAQQCQVRVLEINTYCRASTAPEMVAVILSTCS